MPIEAPTARPDDAVRGPVARPGVILGEKYRLEEAIARGGMARVWRARHIELNRPVAVKFVDGAGAGTSGIERFLLEAKVAASVRHKNVVDILDFGFVEQPGRDPEPYMVMELLEGETLADRIARGPLGDDESVDIALQLLSGLDAVHRAGIIHRDLKPGNLFLTHDHDGTFARLLDFGISEGVEQQTAGAQQQAAGEVGQVVGTPEYMSPEQAFGAAIDLRADLYGVGVMLYEMLGAGRLPFEHDDAHRVLELVVAGDHEPLVALRPQLVELSAVIERALARDPEARFETARDMRRAIVEASGGGDTTTERMAAVRESGTRRRPEPVTAPELAPPVAPTAIPTASPSRALVVGVTTIVAIALLGAAWAATRSVTVTTAEAPARVASPRPGEAGDALGSATDSANDEVLEPAEPPVAVGPAPEEIADEASVTEATVAEPSAAVEEGPAPEDHDDEGNASRSRRRRPRRSPEEPSSEADAHDAERVEAPRAVVRDLDF